MSDLKGVTTREHTIPEIVRKNEQDYVFGQTISSKYVQKSMYDDINKIDAYLNSKHTTSDTDSLGREKPFFNIVTAAVNIWYRSTDIDRKQIKIKPTKSADTVAAFLATIQLHSWMRKANFGSFLNDWGRSLARYGSSVIKFVEKDGELKVNVIPWQRLIVDSVDFNNNVKIEVLEYTEAQLQQNPSYDKEMVKSLCDAHTTRKTLDGQQKDQKSNYIKLYEVHGLLPLSLITDNENDEDTFVQQMHVISFVVNEEGEYDDFTLFKGREAKDPYMITHLIKEDGQTLSIGAVQHLFEAQWMMNHSVKGIKDQLDLASKIIFQTSDGSFVGQNALSAIETGDILVHKANQPLTQIANNSHEVTSWQAFSSQWKSLSNEITGISESMLGNTAPSGTAWRQVETLLQQNQSLFELMTENKGLYIEEMLREYVIPFIKTKLNTKEEIVATLEVNGIDQIENIFIKNTATKNVNKKIKDSVFSYLKGDNATLPTQNDQTMMMGQEKMNIQQSLKDQGGNRFFKPSELGDKTWKDLLKDFEWDCEVDITGEDTDKDMVTTLNTMLMTIAKNPMVLQDETAKMIFNKILTQTGAISPIELSQIKNAPPPPVPAPVQTPQPLPQSTQTVT